MSDVECSRAKEAQKKLADLKKDCPTFTVGGSRRITLRDKILNRPGYEDYKDLPALSVMVNDEREHSCITYFVHAELGVAYAFLPQDSILVDEKPLQRGSSVSYEQLFYPEASTLLCEWILDMKTSGEYIDPPKISLPRPF